MFSRFLAVAVVVVSLASLGWSQDKKVPDKIQKSGIEYAVDPKAPTTVFAQDAKGKMLWKVVAVSGIPAKHKPTATLKKLSFSETEGRLDVHVQCKDAEFTVEIDLKTGKVLRTTPLV